jgi:hypothetical protein
VSWLVVDPKKSSTIYAGTGRGLVKSTNGGASWAFVNIAPATRLVAPLVLDPQESNTLYAVTELSPVVETDPIRSGIVKSTDGGASWNALPGSQALRPVSLTVDPATPSTLYGVAWYGGAIFKSADGGESWIEIKAAGFRQAFFSDSVLAVDPLTPSTIYAGSFAAATLGYDGQGSISKSTDGGQEWRAVHAGIPTDAFVTSFTIDPASPANVYASYRGRGGWGIIKSTDRGESWTVINAGLPSGKVAGSPVVIDPRSPSTLYAGYVDHAGNGAGGILKSTDAGASWIPANAGRTFIDARVLVIDPVNADNIYAAVGTDGVFKSVDGGANWTRLAVFQFPPTRWAFLDAHTRVPC